MRAPGLAALALTLGLAVPPGSAAGDGAGSAAAGRGEPPGDAVRGARLYESRCGACHDPDAHRIGPAHRGVFGRRAGSAAGFDYSPALRASPVVWDERTLDAWLADPERVVPGQAMGFRVDDAHDRADLIAYLHGLR